MLSLLRCIAESKDIFYFRIGNRLVKKRRTKSFTSILKTVRKLQSFAKGESLIHRAAILTGFDSIKIASGSLWNSPSAFLVN